MCGGGSRAPEIKQPPKADPRPTIEPTESSPQGRVESRRKRTRQYRSGFASTNPTGAQGVQDEQKTTLGQ